MKVNMEKKKKKKKKKFSLIYERENLKPDQGNEEIIRKIQRLIKINLI